MTTVTRKHEGGEGVKNAQKYEHVIYERSLMKISMSFIIKANKFFFTFYPPPSSLRQQIIKFVLTE